MIAGGRCIAATTRASLVAGGSPQPAEAFGRRFSLCCGREGCRHRATPPSVRFLGRRVYVGAVVIVASAIALTTIAASAVGTRDGRTGAHHAPMAALVARAVHGERSVRGAVGAAGARARSPSAARLAARAARRRSLRCRREAADVAGADHHDELPRRITLAEGRDVDRDRPAVFAQKMALPVFSPSA